MAATCYLATGRRSKISQRIHRRIGYLRTADPDGLFDKVLTQQGDAAEGESA